MVVSTGKIRFKPLLGMGLALLITFSAITVAMGAFGLKLPLHPEPAVWQVSGTQGTAYLMTTLNMGNDDFYPLNAKIENLFTTCTNLVVTVDLTKIDSEALNAAIITAAMYPDSEAISDWLSPAEIQRCTEVFARYGIELEQLTLFRPWFLTMMLESIHQQKIGYFTDQSLDLYFLNQADGKNIIGLENPIEQATLFAHFSPTLEKKLLLTALEKDFSRETGELVTAWWQGDLARLEKIIFTARDQDPDARNYNEQIYFARNRRMADQIGELLSTGESYFILLPCGHFLGSQGMIRLLQAKGFSVQRVEIGNFPDPPESRR